MKVDVKLDVSAKDFYDVIINSVIEDIKVCTNKTVDPYVGFKYKKQLKRYNKSAVDTEFEITTLTPNEHYEYKVITPVEITSVSYQITPLSDSTIQVLYNETAMAEKALVKGSQKIMGTLFSTFFGKRKMKKRFHSIESYIKNK